jgi:hypothetical protein
MVFSSVSLFVGAVTVPDRDFITALFGDLSVEELEEKLDSANLIDYLNDTLLKPGPDDGSQPRLTVQQLTHDVNEKCPIVIGIDLGVICINSRYLWGEDKPPTVVFTDQTLQTAMAQFDGALAQLHDKQPTLAALIPGPAQVIFVQNDCACCS